MIEAPIIDINEMGPDKSKCLGCKASDDHICRLANLQNLLGKTPTYIQMGFVGIKMSNIPTDCPNGYKAKTSHLIK
jgi:hypothetical protein